jgi:parallel beta-helix repeat protein
MNRKSFAWAVAAVAFGLLSPGIAAAWTNPISVVGIKSAACPNPQFSTIQAAVNAATAGTTIRICPGTYPEQVTIAKSLNLQGESGVVIEPANVVANVTGMASGQSIAAIILVQGTTDADIEDVTVDGASSGITQCAPDLVGIYYRNASGDMRRVAVRNVKLTANLNGCQSGSAILVQSGDGGISAVNIEGSSVHDYQKNGITANEAGTQVRLDHNVITGVGPTSGAAQNGIQIGFGAKGSVEHNAVANHVWSPCVSLQQCDFVSIGILVTGSDGVSVDQNSVGVSQVGIAISANHARVFGNRVFDSMVADGIELLGNDNDARDNRITHSDRAGIFLQGNNNEIQGNRVNEAAFGVLKITGSAGNVIANNEFFNTGVSVQDPADPSLRASPYR